MNKVNVLYQNLNFKSGIYKNLEAPLFASDDNLTDLLEKASITNYEKLKKDIKKTSNTKITGSFQKHPRYINDNSLVSVNEFENDDISDDKYEDTIRRVTCYKHHIERKTSAETIIKPLPLCKVINTNVPKIKELEITEKIIEGKRSIMNNRHSHRAQATPEILGVNLKSYLIKICAWMQEIRTTIQQGIAPVEGAEDYFKRERRATEFSSRFARNYVYQLGRQLIELRRNIQRSALNSARPSAPTPGRSLTNACQTVLQAVQAYCNHVPTTVYIPSDNNSVHIKFNELLKDVGDLCRIIKKLSCTYYDVSTCSSIIEDIEVNSKTLLTLVEETLIKRTDLEVKQIPTIKKPTQKSSKGTNNKNGYDIPFHKRNPLENRLSMYSVSFKKEKKGNPNFKKSSEMSRQRLYNIQKPKNVTTTPVQVQNTPPPVPEKKPERKIQVIQPSTSNSHISIEPFTINEDEIQTMVQRDKKEVTDLQTTGIRGRLEPLLKSLVAEVSAGKQEDLLGQGVCEDMLLKLKDLLNQVQRPVQNSSPKKSNSADSIPRNYIQVTGPKNAKLICIKDKSLFESKTETETIKSKKDISHQHKSLSLLPSLERNQSRKLTKCDSQLIANLPKQYTINIIQYKIDFHKFTKPLMMYKKSSQVLPWILTGKITDSLFDHLLISVLSEININSLADKMYRAEFETF